MFMIFINIDWLFLRRVLLLVQSPISFLMSCFEKQDFYYIVFQQLSLKLIDQQENYDREQHLKKLFLISGGNSSSTSGQAWAAQTDFVHPAWGPEIARQRDPTPVWPEHGRKRNSKAKVWSQSWSKSSWDGFNKNYFRIVNVGTSKQQSFYKQWIVPHNFLA